MPTTYRILFGTIQTLFLAQGGVEAARSKLSCYEDYPMTCEEHKVPLEEIDFDLEETCYRIENEILPGSKKVTLFPDIHPEYLNGIEAKHEFCPQMQEAYSHCSFCYGRKFVDQCEALSFRTRCGERPSRQQLLQDGNIPQFQNNEDIERTCNDLKLIYNQSQYNKTWPRTYDMCKKQEHVKHLCHGECTNGCFEDPPTCTSNLNNVGTEIGWEEVCQDIRFEAFQGVDHRTIFNESKRLEYLRAIPKNHSMCPAFRQAYPYCYWCSGEDALCFHNRQPPTCRPPLPRLEEINDTLVNSVCASIFLNLIYTPEKELYNVAAHGKYLGMLKNTSECSNAQQMYHLCPWCAASELRCFHSPCDKKNATIPENFVLEVMEAFNMSGENNEAVCQSDEMQRFFWEVAITNSFTTASCYVTHAVAKLCGEAVCPQPAQAVEINRDYLGTTTQAQRIVLIWASRTSAILSFFGATFILYDILTDQESRSTVYHQLLIGMATFDIVTAVAWCFATAPINKNDPAANHVEGAIGTDATCRIQAFFIQLGFTSIFYNVSLATYYVLVIAYGWKEFQLKKIRPYMHLIPLMVGAGLAFGGIPLYHWIEYGCHIEPLGLEEDDDDQGSLWSVLVFVVLPLGLSILAITVSMAIVYNSVRKRSAASRKWSFGIGQASKLEKAVFWQCLFYVLAFYITWPIMFCVYLFSVDVKAPLGLTMAIAFVAPLQGCSNACVYIRPKLVKQGSVHKEKVHSFFSRMFTVILPGRMQHPSQTANSGTDNDDPLAGMDPSVVVAMDSETISQKLSMREKPGLVEPHVSLGSADTYRTENFTGEEMPSEDHETAIVSKEEWGSQIYPLQEESQNSEAISSNPTTPEEKQHDNVTSLSTTAPASQSVEPESDPELVALRRYAEQLRPHMDASEGTQFEDETDVTPTTNVEDTDDGLCQEEDGFLLYPRYSSEERKDWSQYLRKS